MKEEKQTPNEIKEQPEEKRLLLEWEAPSRPFKKRDKEFFTTIITLSLVFCVILFFMKDFFGILVVLALLFMTHALATIPPENIKNKIFTTGIQNDKHFYTWEDLVYYTFDKKLGQTMMVSVTKNKLPGAVFMLLGEIPKEKIEEIVGTRLRYKESLDKNFLDKAASWVAKKIPLEKNS